MAEKTSRYNLTKPSAEDFYDVNVQNENMDIIDGELLAVSNVVNSLISSTSKLQDDSNEYGMRLGSLETMQSEHRASANPHGITATTVGLGNVPNVATNDQTPTYTEASTLAALTSGEKMSVAFGKIKKAIADFISHLANTTMHVTSAERTAWNGKAPSSHASSATTYGVGTASNYGHLKITDNPETIASDVAASTKALKSISDDTSFKLIKTQTLNTGKVTCPSGEEALFSLDVTGINPDDYTELVFECDGSLTLDESLVTSRKYGRYCDVDMIFITQDNDEQHSAKIGLFSLSMVTSQDLNGTKHDFNGTIRLKTRRNLVSKYISSSSGTKESYAGIIPTSSTGDLSTPLAGTLSAIKVQLYISLGSNTGSLSASTSTVVKVYGKKGY